jgi:hypothetical protein
MFKFLLIFPTPASEKNRNYSAAIHQDGETPLLPLKQGHTE